MKSVSLFRSSFGKKFLTIAFFLVLIGTPIAVGLSQPSRVEALSCPPNTPTPSTNQTSVPVSDSGVFQMTMQTQNYTKGLNTKECYLNTIVKNIAKEVIHQVVSSIIDWINRGFEGGPTFVTNPQQFFMNIADEELGRLIDGSALGFVCDPFRIQIQFSFLGQRNRSRSIPRCTITSIVKNFDGFIKGNFEDGGWTGWFSLAQTQNNPYGSYLLAEQKAEAKISARQNSAKMTLDWGRGFKSILNRNGEIQTPGTYVEQNLSKATGLELDNLNLAREFDDIVIALLNLGVSQIMQKGLGR